MSALDPLVLEAARDNRARMLSELRRMENGGAPGVTRFEIEMLRDKVRELDALLRDHAEPLAN